MDGGCEEVVFVHDPPTGLRAIVAIHSTALGPSLGGTRFFPFRTEDDAIADVVRLARAMTFKAAAAGLDQGGGKAVIIGDPRTDKTEELLRAYGRFVETLGGRYVTAEDIGTSQADMDVIRTETRFVTGVSPSLGGSGDPSVMTAYGVFLAIRASLEEAMGEASLAGRRVAVQGVGKVGSHLVKHLIDAGAKVVVSDVDEAAAGRLSAALGVDAIDPDKIHAEECDVFSPCAMGGVIGDRTIPDLRCRVVCGAANNQLERPEHAQALAAQGILYAPDYVVNAGGVINISEEARGYEADRAKASVERIEGTLGRVFAAARDRGVTPLEAADGIARARIAGLPRLRGYWAPGDATFVRSEPR
ncbi:MAG TPA: Glu/Leu/Phe/Val dehydrogenase [Actinomycetota bacterium]